MYMYWPFSLWINRWVSSAREETEATEETKEIVVTREEANNLLGGEEEIKGQDFQSIVDVDSEEFK